MLKRSALCVVWTTLISSMVAAQTLPVPNARGSAQVPAANAAAPATPAEAGANPPVVPPALPTSDDPLLTPVPLPAKVLSSWQEALALVRTQSTVLAGARTRVERAEADVTTARSHFLPTLTGTAQATDHLIRTELPAGTIPLCSNGRLPCPSAYWGAALNLSVPVIAAQSWYDWKTAKHAVNSAKLDAKEIEREQVAQVAVAIVNVVTSERLAEVSRVSLNASLSTLKLTQRRAELGAASRVDVLRVEQDAEAARAQVISASETLRQAREALGQVLGMSEAVTVNPDLNLDGLATDAARTCSRQNGIELRPDIVASNAAAAVARRRVDSVDYAFLPTVNGTSTLTYYSEPIQSPNRDHVTWTIGGLLTWQIYDGGARYADRAARRTDWELAQQHVRDVDRLARIEVTQTMRGVSVAEANLSVSQRNRDILVETARLTQIGYLNGTGTSFDLVDAARRLREGEIDLTIKEFEVLKAKIAAFLALAKCDV